MNELLAILKLKLTQSYCSERNKNKFYSHICALIQIIINLKNVLNKTIKDIMKKYTLCFIFIFFSIVSRGQNGLENIVVERYYVSDANDATQNSTGGVLPVGSVTYRIYADMLQGYKFQAAYGVPGHEMRIETTTLFFNNEDRGATSPTYTKAQASHNTVMLDSWLSVGAACSGNFGILKSEDDGVATVSNTDGVLQNTDPSAGIPLSTEDGMVAGSPEAVTAVGITTEISVFDAQNDGTNGPLFATSNGSWASLNGSIGPDSVDNKVLIAQITTDGVFSFELNIQIGTPNGGVENYVAQNPVANEIQMASLIYSSTTGVKNVVAKSQSVFVAYPNPLTDKLSIQILAAHTEGTASYTLYDLSGKSVLQKDLGQIHSNQIEDLDLSSLAKGCYILGFNTENGVAYQRIVKD